jgi:hypothetical protein
MKCDIAYLPNEEMTRAQSSQIRCRPLGFANTIDGELKRVIAVFAAQELELGGMEATTA